MAKKKELINPFYVLLVVAGIVFAVTACAYGVMAFHAVRSASSSVDPATANRFLSFMSEHGDILLGGELLVLAVATVGAIGTDRYWSEWQTRRHAETPAADTANEPS